MATLPKVLLLGDSIRMSYQPHVARLLEGKATVVGPADNCQYSLFTLSSLDRWVGELGKPDIVHWNNGLHDSGHNPDRSPVQIPVEMYCSNLGFILKRLKAWTPHVLWATMTPMHPSRPFRATEWSWRNDEVVQYNDAARTLMQSHGVPITELHKLVWDNRATFFTEDGVHLAEIGQKACAQAVVAAVSACL